MPEPVLRAEGFGYRYPTAERDALSDVTLSLEPGSFTLVVGESGSGKSTLLRAACGLVPHFHGGDARGELDVGGMSVRDHGPNELAAVCATLLQDPETQVVMGGVRAELSLPLEQRGHEPAAIARAVEEAALELGVAELLDRRTDTLSGGELQRVALAAAVAGRPSVLVLDEATSQLDPVAGDELVWLLRRLNEEWGTAVLLAEHRLERCLAAADRVLVMESGRVALDAAPADFLDWAAEHRPVLATPAARLFSLAGLGPAPVSVKQARDRLDGVGLVPPGGEAAPSVAAQSTARPAMRFEGVWHEIADGPAILRGVDLVLRPGELVALMGRNGAGKSTLLRHAKGLVKPTRGRIRCEGEVALLLQSPGDFLIHEHVGDEAGPAAIASAGLSGREREHPRDLSGGERQRLALEVVLEGADAAVVCLDEPTRGMDGAWKHALSERLRELAARGAAVVVATHDTEFAARWAERVVLMGRGDVIADGPALTVLSGGRHFTTDVSRILGGALTPEAGAEMLAKELVP
ncbi:MAG: energy-coupling factor transport system ATP-binding protein [Thermoleophilaceae bacterium]|nr:energy-coupling factor transport system ATP-binding protein [Thermoleophilaceae bacterium]